MSEFERGEFLFDDATGTRQATPDAARHLTDRIKVAIEGSWLLIQEAYVTRTWAVLGYDSWDAYCSEEFGASRLRLPREERQEVVASLRESGLSTRAIASATGVSEGSVRNDLKAGAQNYAPAEERPRVQGADGRSYAPTRSAPTSRPTSVPEPDLISGNDWVESPREDEGPILGSPGFPAPFRADRYPDDEDADLDGVTEEPPIEGTVTPLRRPTRPLMDVIEEHRPGAKAEVNRARVRSRWSSAMAAIADLPLMDPDEVIACVGTEGLGLGVLALRSANGWMEQLDTRLRSGLRAVGGDER